MCSLICDANSRKLLPVRHAGDRFVAILAHPPDEAIVRILVLLEGDEPRRQTFGSTGRGKKGLIVDLRSESERCEPPSSAT